MASYQTGAYVLILPSEVSRREIIRADHCPSAPASVLRGRDQGHLAYPTEGEAVAAMATLAAWDAARGRNRGPFHLDSMSVAYEPSECILV